MGFNSAFKGLKGISTFIFPPFVLPNMLRLLESRVWGIINRMLQNTVEHKTADWVIPLEIMSLSTTFCRARQNKQDRQCTYNVTVRRVTVAVVAVEK